MTFYPKFGTWTEENFTSPEDVTLSSFQTVEGGFLALKPSGERSRAFISRWTPISNWTLENSLNTFSVITGTFRPFSGVVITGQKVPAGKEGYQQTVGAVGALEFYTPIPYYAVAPEFTGYSGQVKQCIVLDKNSPNRIWYSAYTGGIQESTIEFDIASSWDVYSGRVQLGFTTGEELISNLPPIRSAYVGHGLYIDNGQYWDYLEINPFGIRSLNSPEFAIPIRLDTPKRVRIGINGTSVLLTTEDSKGVYGSNILKTPVVVGADPKLAFGAPPISGDSNRFPFVYYGISGIVGNTFWDNIKIYKGSSQVTSVTGLVNYYTTEPQTGYTNIFDPGIPINNWNTARVGFIPYAFGGTTVVTAQYSGIGGWKNGSSVTLTSQASPVTLDISNIPVYYNSRESSTHGRIYNPIRFRIVQQSEGRTPAPPVDYIAISASSEQSYLDIVPNWKPVDVALLAQLAVKQSTFDNLISYPSKFSTFVLNSPGSTGLYYDQFLTNEDTTQTGSVWASGYVDIIYAGHDTTALRNYTVTTVRASGNSDAANYLGTSPVSNCFYNKTLEEGFNSITGSPDYVQNRSYGVLANGLSIVPSYTGRATIYYDKKQVYRTVDGASDIRSNQTDGRSQQQTQSYVQSVYAVVQSFQSNDDVTLNTYDSSCGVEIDIPSGICNSGKYIFSMDLQVEQGTGIYIYATGLNVSGSPAWYVDGTQFRTFNKVSFPIASKNNNDFIKIGVVVSPGTKASETVIYNIDNIEFSPYVAGHVYATGIPTYFHQSGLLRDYLRDENLATDISTVPAVRSSTVLGLDINLHGYPTGANNIIFEKKRDSDNKGYRLYCSKNGYLAATVDTEAQAWAYDINSISPFTGSRIQTGLVSEYKIPLSKWINIGLVHQTDTYTKLGYCNYSGAIAPANFASTNRLYLLADGIPVGALDLMSNWNSGSHTQETDRSPYLSYLCDGSGRVTIASGLIMDFDKVELARPPIADAEIDYSIKIARSTKPYFVPDVYLKPTVNTAIKNFLVAIPSGDSYDADRILGHDYFLGSIYNFDNPGYTNWDHGPWRNHLLFYGNVQKFNNSPYDPTGAYKLGSTYFASGSFALAKYSSAMDRQFNSTGNLEVKSSYYSYAANTNTLRVLGWACPFNSGQDFFHLHEDEGDLQGRRLSFGFTNDMRLKLHLLTGSYEIWSRTGNVTHNISGWNWVGFQATLPDYTGEFTTGMGSITLFSNSGLDARYLNNISGTGHGFQYYGRSGHTTKSCIIFGRTASIALNDFAITCPTLSDTSYTDLNTLTYNYLGNKSGRYNTVMENTNLFIGRYSVSGFNNMYVVITGSNNLDDTMYWVAAHNSYDNSCRLNGGIHLFDDEPFRFTDSYYLNYNPAPIRSMIGNQMSPIRIGNQVPLGAINLARITSPNFNTEASISNVDLADTNLSNLLAYKAGEYTIGSGQFGVFGTGAYNSTGNFKGINSIFFSGRKNYEMTGQVYSQNIDVTPISLCSINSTESYPAYYYYLIGRGLYGVSVTDANPHPGFELSGSATGNKASVYIDNLQKIKNAITIRNSAGSEIPFDAYPYDVVSSPYTYSDLFTSVASGIHIDVDGLTRLTGTSGIFTGRLPNGVFSVALLLNKNYISSEDSVWVHYPAYSYQSNKIISSKKEVVNASPLVRRNLDDEAALPGRYSINLDSRSLLYTVKIFGVDNDYTGKL